MWYLIACVATPVSVSCITPVSFRSVNECEAVGERWRMTAHAVRSQSNAQSYCMLVEANTRPQSDPPTIEVPVIPIR